MCTDFATSEDIRLAAKVVWQENFSQQQFELMMEDVYILLWEVVTVEIMFEEKKKLGDGGN